MERYTKRLDDGQAVMDCQNCPESWMNKPNSDCSALYCWNRLKDRIAAYEDTGLEPEEITRIVDEYGHGHTLRTHAAERLELIREIPTDRLRDLVEADRDGRCVVYSKGFPVVSTYLQEGGLYIRETSGVIGYEEYNAALKGEPNGKQTGEAL